jgi:hypothetical protein
MFDKSLNMKKTIFLICVGFGFLLSCEKDSCRCYKKLGYEQVNAIWKSNDSLVASKKIYYQETLFFKAESLNDSISAFMLLHLSDSITFRQFDSIYVNEKTGTISKDEIPYYRNQDYSCVCSD